jgi:hypothetical protein
VNQPPTREPSRPAATAIGGVLICFAGLGGFTLLLGFVAGPPPPPSALRAAGGIVMILALSAIGVGLLRRWPGTGIAAVALLLASGIAAGAWCVWFPLNHGPQETDGMGYVWLGAVMISPATIVGAALLLHDQRQERRRHPRQPPPTA